ncbi:hypothetical protein NDU88_006963 [Pleurodeles waltl]|uniref:Uncharacterized protein n=1 Tax=Pleurodeles waltl TaxID=8319 RepID=A0AAV7LU25_PLEWA|nr:hypothetical protein NDU88_006963 [Pleurodeles waltl]
MQSRGPRGTVNGSPLPVLTTAAAPLFQCTLRSHGLHPRRAPPTSLEESHAGHASYGLRGPAASPLHHCRCPTHRSGQPHGIKAATGALPLDPLLRVAFSFLGCPAATGLFGRS